VRPEEPDQGSVQTNTSDMNDRANLTLADLKAAETVARFVSLARTTENARESSNAGQNIVLSSESGLAIHVVIYNLPAELSGFGRASWIAI